jgi:flagellar basal-body rod protein FlgC
MAAIPGLNTAVSGMHAARTQVNVAADNLANARSVAPAKADGPATDGAGRPLFRAGRTTLQAQETGGVRAAVEPVRPTSVQRYQPDAADANARGMVNRPNVSYVRETAAQIGAQAQFSANLATVETGDEMTERLLDVTG